MFKVSFILVSFCISGLALAQEVQLSADAKGLQIMQKMKAQDRGWKSSKMTMTMNLYNKQGQKSTRFVRLQSLEIPNDGDISLSIFDKPRDVKGTVLLSYSHSQKPDEQWLYLPALKRVKRISSRNKSGPFMGSEFSYEDLSSFELDKYRYKYLGEDTYEGEKVFIVESIPQYSNSGYSKIIILINQQNYTLAKNDFYDRKGSHLKTLTFSGYKLFLTKFWRAHTYQMVNHQNNRYTTLEWSGYQFDVGLTKKDFSQRKLKSFR